MVQSKICIHLLQPAVLFLQFFHAAQLLTVHAGVLLFPVIKSGLVHTQFTADVRCGLTRFMLFDRRNDLALADSCLFHRSVVKVTNSRILTSPIFWEGYRLTKSYSLSKAYFAPKLSAASLADDILLVLTAISSNSGISCSAGICAVAAQLVTLAPIIPIPIFFCFFSYFKF